MSGQIACDFATVYEPHSLTPLEHRMRFSAARRAGRAAGPLAALIALAGISVGTSTGTSTVLAAEHGFPYDGTLLLEAKPMKGSKRVPILQIESKGEASIDLWCNTVPAQLIVVDDTITIILGAPTEKQCDPDRMQADQGLMAALQQVATWRRQDDLLTLQGEQTLRFHLSTN
jgi:heat shock protein HslJ